MSGHLYYAPYSHLVFHIFPKHHEMTSRKPHYRSTKFHRVTNPVLPGEEILSPQLCCKIIYVTSPTFENVKISLVDMLVFSLETPPSHYTVSLLLLFPPS